MRSNIIYVIAISLIYFLLSSDNCMAAAPTVIELQNQIKLLELRVSKLEEKRPVVTKNGLKVTDLGGKTIGGSKKNLPQGGESIPPAMIEKFMKQIEEYKKKKNETQDYMDQLMKEDDERFK